MSKPLLSAILVAVVAIVLVGMTLLQFGVLPHSGRGWAAAILIGVPLVILMEGAGEWASGLEFFPSAPAPVRIFLGVIVVSIFLLLAYVPLRYLIAMMQS